MKRASKFSLLWVLVLTVVLTSASFALLPGTGARYVAEWDAFVGPRVVYSYVWSWGTVSAAGATPTLAGTWTVPTTGWYGFALVGGQGGFTPDAHLIPTMGANVRGGLGGVAKGAIHLTAGEEIRIIVGHGGMANRTGGHQIHLRGGPGHLHGGGGGGLTAIFRGAFPALTAANNNTPAAPTAAQLTSFDAIAVAAGGGGSSRGATEHRSGGNGGVQNGPGIGNGQRGQDTTGNGGLPGTDTFPASVGGNGWNASWLTGGGIRGAGWSGGGGAGWFGGNPGGNITTQTNTTRPGGGGSSWVVGDAVPLPDGVSAGPLADFVGHDPTSRGRSTGTNVWQGQCGSVAIVFLGTRNPTTIDNWL